MMLPVLSKIVILLLKNVIYHSNQNRLYTVGVTECVTISILQT